MQGGEHKWSSSDELYFISNDYFPFYLEIASVLYTGSTYLLQRCYVWPCLEIQAEVLFSNYDITSIIKVISVIVMALLRQY